MKKDQNLPHTELWEKYQAYLDLRGISIKLEKEPIVQQESYEIY